MTLPVIAALLAWKRANDPRLPHADVEHDHSRAEQHHAAVAPVVAGVAVFEIVRALQAYVTFAVARRFDRTNRDRVVEQQQTFGVASGTRGFDRRLAHPEARQPERAERDEQNH